MAPTFNETAFVIDHISELKLDVEVIFFGDQLKAAILYLHTLYDSSTTSEKFQPKYLFIYRTPSEIVYDARSYEMITMPRCDEMYSTFNNGCVYELMPVLKFYSNQMRSGAAQHSIWNAAFSHWDIEEMMFEFERHTSRPRTNDISHDEPTLSAWRMESVYNEMACSWLSDNLQNKMNWYVDNEKIDIVIGGIFPMRASGAIYSGMCFFVGT